RRRMLRRTTGKSRSSAGVVSSWRERPIMARNSLPPFPEASRFACITCPPRQKDPVSGNVFGNTVPERAVGRFPTQLLAGVLDREGAAEAEVYLVVLAQYVPDLDVCPPERFPHQ